VDPAPSGRLVADLDGYDQIQFHEPSPVRYSPVAERLVGILQTRFLHA